MANKKSSKKKKTVKQEVPVEKKGEEVVSEPAHVEEAFITVRGTSVGGTQKMTQSEYDAYIAKTKKKK